MDGIEKDAAGKLRVLRIDVQSQVGQSLAAKLKFLYTPTFIFFNNQGVEIWRSVGRIDAQKVKDSLR